MGDSWYYNYFALSQTEEVKVVGGGKFWSSLYPMMTQKDGGWSDVIAVEKIFSEMSSASAIASSFKCLPTPDFFHPPLLLVSS